MEWSGFIGLVQCYYIHTHATTHTGFLRACVLPCRTPEDKFSQDKVFLKYKLPHGPILAFQVIFTRYKTATMSFTTDFLLILCQIVMVRSFLVNSSASTRVTSYEFQLLSKLILDEQTRTSHLEEDMKDLIKDQQTMKNSKVALDTQLNTTKSEQIATRQELIATRQELIATKSELNATKSELNATKRELEGQMKTLKSIKAKLDKEIINRHQLQMTYSALVTDFHNLSVSVNSNTIDIGILSHKIGRFIKNLKYM